LRAVIQRALDGNDAAEAEHGHYLGIAVRSSGNPPGGCPRQNGHDARPDQHGSHQSPVAEAGDCEGDSDRHACHLGEHLDRRQGDEAQVALEERDVLHPGSIDQEPNRHRCRHPHEARFVKERDERWGGR
jgi:hypothetical protein